MRGAALLCGLVILAGCGRGTGKSTHPIYEYAYFYEDHSGPREDRTHYYCFSTDGQNVEGLSVKDFCEQTGLKTKGENNITELEMLNYFGSQGWELCAGQERYTEDTKGNGRVTRKYIFRRNKNP